MRTYERESLGAIMRRNGCNGGTYLQEPDAESWPKGVYILRRRNGEKALDLNVHPRQG